MRRFASSFWLSAALAAGPSWAQSESAQKPQEAGDEGTVLKEVEVKGDRTVVPPPPFDARQSVTTRDAEDLRRGQPASIFEALKDIPNVVANGGPRASGMNFSIRGFSDTEDVLIKLDGVPKSFEKYRFGGTFIEPDLLKLIEVQRGPQIQSGSGSLGGTISAATKDAADLLDPGERFGARLKLGRADNNNEDLRSFVAYARPTPWFDVVVNSLRRESGDIKLSDGSRLALSSAATKSNLAKVGVVAGDALLSFSQIEFADAGLQPYDATGGLPGLFGTVTRTVRDTTRAFSLEYAGGHPWVNLKLVAGEARTRMIDLMQPGQTPFANTATGVVTDTYDYHNRTLDIANTSRFTGLPFGLEVLAGVQLLDSERDVTRFRQKIPDSGFDASIPPGIKRYLAGYVQPRLRFGRLELIPGLRVDHYAVVATGGTEALLAANGEARRIDFEKATSSFGAVYGVVPERLSVFYNVAQAFRPPLVDEAFTRGAFSRCATFLLGAVAPKSQICGSMYRPQESLNQELGATFTRPLETWRGRFDAKLTLFQIDTTHLLRSLQAVSLTEAGQPGWEKRHGIEIETSLRSTRGYLRASYARIRGQVDEGGGKTPSNPQPLYNAPGDTLNVAAGVFLGSDVEIGVGFQQVDARRVITATVGTVNVIGTQPGYELWSANARWVVNRHVEFRLSGENLNNRKYNLVSSFGGGIGFEAPGVNLRLAMVLRI